VRVLVSAAVLGLVASGLACVGNLPVKGAACPCPAGYCCGANDVCVELTTGLCTEGQAGVGAAAGHSPGGAGGQAGVAGASGAGGAHDAAVGASGASGADAASGAAGGSTVDGASGPDAAPDSALDEAPDVGSGAGDTGDTSADVRTLDVPCGPGSCPNGCCLDGRCVSGRATSECGTGGGSCRPCGGCEICSASGTCDIDPASSWDVVCVSAVLAPTLPNGQPWDPGNGADKPAPDPFCQLEEVANQVDSATGKSTNTIQDTYTPSWNFDVTPAGHPMPASKLLSTSAPWRIWVGDDDGCNATGCFGQEACEIDQPLPASALSTGQLTVQNRQSCLSFTVKFVCMSPPP
jgi:hypothetical protein